MRSRMLEAISSIAVEMIAHWQLTNDPVPGEIVELQKYSTCSKIAALSSGATMTFFF